MVEPMEVMDQGTMAVFIDPTGAAISVWQPAVMKGAELINTPNSFSWNELHTRDMAKAREFYSKVFPWAVKTNAIPGGGEYTEFQINGRSIAGGMPKGKEMPPIVPPHWLVDFPGGNPHATVKRAP